MAETHVSWVVFIGERAIKVKKPVRTPFLDFSTTDLRRKACEREVRLNRRLAPDVYEGVATVTGPDGAVCDYLVVMRRMPAERRLAALATSGEGAVEYHLGRIADVMSNFHRGAERSAIIDRAASAESLTALWEAGRTEMLGFGEFVDPSTVEQAHGLAIRYLDGRHPLLARRIAEGRVVDGHGDLLADDIFCLDDGPRILDCLEFDDHLRYGDVVGDVAFLAMDLEHLGRADLATLWLERYRRASGDDWPASLVDHYIAYRAHVRAKVACWRAVQGADGAADEARLLLGQCLERLRKAAVRIVLVGGLPGTGKSTLAAAMGAQLGWDVVRSDVVRKQLAGLEPATPASAAYGQGLYTAGHRAATYDALLDRAAREAGLGRSVILDATWASDTDRSAARNVAENTGADLVELECVTPGPVAWRRLADRSEAGGDPSDATAPVTVAMSDAWQPWTSAHRVDSDRPGEVVLVEAIAAVGL
ncbi:MAG: AAA family ATPase [Actinomycetota bacterium]|nr:AAA family ATPase [Actinomycetota bacterium]